MSSQQSSVSRPTCGSGSRVWMEMIINLVLIVRTDSYY